MTFLQWWRKLVRRPAHGFRPFPPRPYRPGVESLEDRFLLATILVNSTSDAAAVDGQVTLREAIQSVNAGGNVSDVVATGVYGSSDTIRFAIPTPGGATTIFVGSTGLGGLPVLSRTVFIDGFSQGGAG